MLLVEWKHQLSAEFPPTRMTGPGCEPAVVWCRLSSALCIPLQSISRTPRGSFSVLKPTKLGGIGRVVGAGMVATDTIVGAARAKWIASSAMKKVGIAVNFRWDRRWTTEIIVAH